MADSLVNRCSFTLAAAVTSGTQTSITRTSATDGLPGDSNGPASGTYVFVMTDGSGNYELARVTGGQGTTTLTIARAVEAIGGTQTALSSVPNGTVCYAIGTAGDLISNPMTSPGDLILGASGGAAARLPGASGLSVLQGSYKTGVAVTFNGTTGQVNTPYGAPAATKFSIMCWLYLPATFTQQYPRCFDTGSPYNVSGVGIGYTAGPGMEGEAFDGTVGNVVEDPTAYGGLAGTWQCYVFTYDGSHMILYRQGVSVASVALAGATIVASTTTAMIATDIFEGANGYYNGGIAHCAYWPGVALTATQVAAIYGNASTMGESAYESYIAGLSPVIYYPLQETSGTTATNLGTTGATNNGTYSGGYTLAAAGPITGAASGVAWSDTLATTPPAPTTAAITSGTAWHNATGADVMVYLPVTYNPTGTVASTLTAGVGSTSSPTTFVEHSEPISFTAGLIVTSRFYVPAGWYLKATVASGTLGTAHIQPI